MNPLLESYPTATNRDKILLSAFNEMYQHGYQGMRIEAVLKATGLAKGAIYHHFPNKISLAYAVIDEILYEHSKKHFQKALQEHENPIEGLRKSLFENCQSASEEEVALGCPLNNLAQEMSGLDEGFKIRLNKCYETLHNIVGSALEQGQKVNTIRADIDAQQISMFIICAHQGIIGAAKCMQSKDVLTQQTQALCDYIDSLKC